jgi:hypothetical protein
MRKNCQNIVDTQYLAQTSPLYILEFLYLLPIRLFLFDFVKKIKILLNFHPDLR